jgi:hypothetical protein
MFNHTTGDDGASVGSGAYDAGTDCYAFRAQCATPAGAQVFVSYGSHANLALLLHYGFLLPHNAYDMAQLPRSPHLEGLPLDDDADLHVSAADGAPSWRLLAALRLAAAPPALRRQRGHEAAAGSMLDLDSEAQAYARLRRACDAALAALPTTAAEDDALLSAAPVPRMQLALRWRASHKRALRLALQAADAHLAKVAAAQREASGCRVVRSCA